MYKTHKTYIKADMKMSDLLNENHSLLMLLEHLEIDFAVGDKTVSHTKLRSKVQYLDEEKMSLI